VDFGLGRSIDAFRGLVAGPMLQMAVLFVLLGVAFRFTRPGRVRWLAIAASIAIAGASNLASWHWLTVAGIFVQEGVFSGTEREDFIFTQWVAVTAGVLFAACSRQWERTQASALRLRGAQVAQQHSENALLESRLNVVRARIDPAFLFEALAEVKRRCDGSIGEAEALLAELIDYLRASQPQSRARASTLREEFRHAEAYLNLAARVEGAPSQVALRLPEALGEVFFPPMVLVPLLTAGAGRGVTLAAREQASRVLVTVEGASPGGPSLQALRTTIVAFFGPDASVTWGPDDAGTRVTIDYRLADAATGEESP